MEEEILKYYKKDIEGMCNIINTLPIVGIDSANKIITIVNILNSFIKEEKE